MNHISDQCSDCTNKLISMDRYYKLVPCFDFLYICPKHPAKIYFDLSEGELINIAHQEESVN